MWQNRFSLLILPLFLCPCFLNASKKITTPFAENTLSFALFNYDNLIADHYEKTTLYSEQLALLLHRGTGYPIEDFHTLLNDEALNLEPHPVRYMMLINQKTKTLTGQYFIDD